MADQKSLLREVEELIHSKVGESRTLEYKAQMNVANDKDRKEFLADVSSFANSDGGMIIYGITEVKGLPASPSGIPVDNDDVNSLILKLENMLRDSISPRIQGIRIQHQALSNGNFLFRISIPKSHETPYQVTYKGHDRFYGRNSAGKYILDRNEILGLSNADLPGKLKEIQKRRLSVMIEEHPQRPLLGNIKVMLQLIPLQALVSDKEYELNNREYETYELPPLGRGSRTPVNNLEGVFVKSSYPSSSKINAYLQVHRNGIIETLNSVFITMNEEKVFNVKLIEGYVMREILTYQKFYQRIGLESSIHCFLTLKGILGYTLRSERCIPMMNEQSRFETDKLELPPVSFHTGDAGVERNFRVWFDRIWNACGYGRSMHFDNSGRWIYSLDFI